MLGKTLILGLISASAAGGIVYYGTTPQGLKAFEATSNDGIKAETSLEKVKSDVKKAENAVKKAEIDVKKGDIATKKDRDRIEPRLPTVRKSEADDGRKKLASADGLSALANKDMPPEEVGTAEAQPKTQTRWLDQYLKNNKSEAVGEAEPEAIGEAEAQFEEDAESESVGEAEAEAEPEAQPANLDTKTRDKLNAGSATQPRTFRIENGQLVEIGAADAAAEDLEMVVDDAVTEIMEEALKAPHKKAKSEAHSGSAHSGKAYKARKAKKGKNLMSKSEMSDMDDAQAMAEISNKAMAKEGYYTGSSYKGDKPKNRKDHKFNNDISDMANDNTPLLSTVMREAAAIEKPELRDQAYFEITEFALSEGRFDSARIAHDMIEQNELSYTAKSRIAVAYAQKGQPTKAFKVIGEADEVELRDFMRLQVIEALIAPQNLPQTWQEKAN